MEQIQEQNLTKVVELREIFYKMLHNYTRNFNLNIKDDKPNNESLKNYNNISEYFVSFFLSTLKCS